MLCPCNNNCERTVCFSWIQRKCCSSLGLYAGVITLLMPSVLCVSDAPQLTYEAIYNTTDYVQLQNKRPYSVPYSYSFSSSHIEPYSSEDSADNELEIAYDEYERDDGGPLLVGFARDPYRYSIPEKDYLNGVRYINPESLNKNENRGKRGVVHLYNMMYCATGCDPLAYKGYGCYCGFLGSGRPTDGIDRCCKMHDKCYENIYCPFFTVYFQPYYWKCYRGEPLCALENQLTNHHFVNGCAARLCECDRQFAMCVKRYHCPRRRALCRSSPIRLLQNLLMFR